MQDQAPGWWFWSWRLSPPAQAMPWVGWRSSSAGWRREWEMVHSLPALWVLQRREKCQALRGAKAQIKTLFSFFFFFLFISFFFSPSIFFFFFKFSVPTDLKQLSFFHFRSSLSLHSSTAYSSYQLMRWLVPLSTLASLWLLKWADVLQLRIKPSLSILHALQHKSLTPATTEVIADLGKSRWAETLVH